MTALRLRTVLAPIVFGIAVVLVWQLLVTAFPAKGSALPAPFTIAGQFAASAGVIVQASLGTAANAFVGLVVGTLVAVVLAVLAAAWRPLDELSAPVVTTLSVIPIVALAPLFYAMFGASVETGRQMIAAIAVLVPVYVNTLRGLRTVDPLHRDLLRSYAAGRWQTARTVTVPGAVPFLFTGVRIASSLAVISALVAEYFGGPVSGLGKAITSAVSSSNYALAWAFVLGAIVTGLVFYCATALLETLALARLRPTG